MEEFAELNPTKTFIFFSDPIFWGGLLDFLHSPQISVSTCNGTFSGSFVKDILILMCKD